MTGLRHRLSSHSGFSVSCNHELQLLLRMQKAGLAKLTPPKRQKLDLTRGGSTKGSLAFLSCDACSCIRTILFSKTSLPELSASLYSLSRRAHRADISCQGAASTFWVFCFFDTLRAFCGFECLHMLRVRTGTFCCVFCIRTLMQVPGIALSRCGPNGDVTRACC